MTAPGDTPLLCPSAPASPGSVIIGIVQNDRIAKLATPLEVNAAFIASGRSSGSLEASFRFADTCREHACEQWNGRGCGLIVRLDGESSHRLAGHAGLPRCAIRGRCRWWHERGSSACDVCTFVVTDTRPPD